MRNRRDRRKNFPPQHGAPQCFTVSRGPGPGLARPPLLSVTLGGGHPRGSRSAPRLPPPPGLSPCAPLCHPHGAPCPCAPRWEWRVAAKLQGHGSGQGPPRSLSPSPPPLCSPGYHGLRGQPAPQGAQRGGHTGKECGDELQLRQLPAGGGGDGGDDSGPGRPGFHGLW